MPTRTYPAQRFNAGLGLPLGWAYRWAGRLKDGIPDGVKEEGASLTLEEMAKPKFLPVSVTASPVEIELPGGGLVRLPVGVGQAVIVDVIQAVSGLRSRRKQP